MHSNKTKNKLLHLGVGLNWLQAVMAQIAVLSAENIVLR
jgi:hypothetical protein